MTHKFLDILHAAKKEVRLTDTQKSQVRSRLETYMTNSETPARLWIGLPIRLRLLSAIGICMSILIVTGSGISYAAQYALPGDALYGVKLLKEDIAARLTVTPEAQASWNAQRALYRLEEASALAARKKLDEGSAVDIAARFDNNAKQADSSIQNLRENGYWEAAARIASDFSASLDAYRDVLERFESEEDSSTFTSSFRTLQDSIEQISQDAAQQSEDAEHETRSLDPYRADKSAQQTVRSAQQIIFETWRLLSRARGRLSPEGLEEADKNMNEADYLLQRAQEDLDARAYAAANENADAAARIATETRILIHAQATLRLKLIKKPIDKDDDELDRGDKEDGSFSDENSTSRDAIKKQNNIEIQRGEKNADRTQDDVSSLSDVHVKTEETKNLKERAQTDISNDTQQNKDDAIPKKNTKDDIQEEEEDVLDVLNDISQKSSHTKTPPSLKREEKKHIEDERETDRFQFEWEK